MALVNMQRAPKLTPSGPTTDVENISIDVAENGYEVRCQLKQPESSDGAASAYSPGKRYVFQGLAETLAFIGKKLKGDDTADYGAGEDIAAEGE